MEIILIGLNQQIQNLDSIDNVQDTIQNWYMKEQENGTCSKREKQLSESKMDQMLQLTGKNFKTAIINILSEK